MLRGLTSVSSLGSSSGASQWKSISWTDVTSEYADTGKVLKFCNSYGNFTDYTVTGSDSNQTNTQLYRYVVQFDIDLKPNHWYVLYSNPDATSQNRSAGSNKYNLLKLFYESSDTDYRVCHCLGNNTDSGDHNKVYLNTSGSGSVYRYNNFLWIHVSSGKLLLSGQRSTSSSRDGYISYAVFIQNVFKFAEIYT